MTTSEQTALLKAIREFEYAVDNYRVYGSRANGRVLDVQRAKLDAVIDKINKPKQVMFEERD